LSISFEKSIGRFVYRGVDRETGEVVREYPQEEVIERIAHLREIAGIAIDRSL
jgi:flagellar protein FlaG